MLCCKSQNELTWIHFYYYPISIVEDIIVLCNDPLANDLEDTIHVVTRLGVDEDKIGCVRKLLFASGSIMQI